MDEMLNVEDESGSGLLMLPIRSGSGLSWYRPARCGMGNKLDLPDVRFKSAIESNPIFYSVRLSCKFLIINKIACFSNMVMDELEKPICGYSNICVGISKAYCINGSFKRYRSELVDLLKQTKLIIWDEAPMTHKFCFETLDKSLRDIMGTITNDSIFLEDIVHATINTSLDSKGLQSPRWGE
ncbi:hypothetical protein Lal_00017031 [Lupinus albus]|nr:hypothetical protein Lal_00017031 [Lupinus albus]